MHRPTWKLRRLLSFQDYVGTRRAPKWLTTEFLQTISADRNPRRNNNAGNLWKSSLAKSMKAH